MSSLIVEVCKIEKVEKHPNADKLSIATVKGWNCITALDQYKEGDLVIFCPPDSIIPEDIIEQYNLEYLKKGSRVRTVKLRGYISQGLILELPDGDNKVWYEGQDVAEELGITKYEPPAPKYQQGQKKTSKKKRNPLFDKYTDIENIKNYKNVFKEGEQVVITEKIHGTNFRAGTLPISKGYSFLDKIEYWIKKYILKQGYEFVYGSHNVQITHHANRNCFYGEDVYGKIAKKYKLADLIEEDFIIYGEIYGKKIQDLEYGLDDIDLVVFDIKYKEHYLSWNLVERFCTLNKLPIVPVLYEGEYSEDIRVQHTTGQSILCPKQIREGCVIKPEEEIKDPRIGRKILKSVSEKYLLRKGATEFK